MAMSRSRGGMSFTTAPPMEISPDDISSSPAIMRSVVDLPQPDGPTSTTNSLSAISRSMPFTACTPPSYSLTILRIDTCAIPAVSLTLRRAESALAFGCAGREPGDVVVHEESVHHHRRQRGQQRAGHELPPGECVAADQLRDHADGERHLVRLGDEGRGIHERRPGHGEGEDRRR